jgi:HK97 gp10 family phage protein
VKRSGVSITRVNRLIKRLNLIPAHVFDEAEKAITEHSESIRSEASANAPQGVGELSKKIKKRKTKKAKTKVTGSVYSNAPHSIHLEYGTAHQPPQPYLRPAARKTGRLADIVKRIRDAFAKK